MNKTKLGRPALPKKQVKTQLVGVRVSPTESKELIHKADAEDETPAEFMREAARNRPISYVVKAKWPVSELNDKKILAIVVDRTGREVHLPGRIAARDRSDKQKGAISINLTVFVNSGNSLCGSMTPLPQDLVDCIEKSDGKEWYEYTIKIFPKPEDTL